MPAAKLKLIPNSGTYPIGFYLGAVATKVKKNGKNDLCLVHSAFPCTAAGVFTTNKFCAAPVTVSQEVLKSARISSLVINSGCANACTGSIGLDNARKMSQAVNEALPAAIRGTVVFSTGVIGQQLQMSKVLNGISQCKSILGETHEHVQF